MNNSKILEAGKIAKQVVDWIKPQIKKDIPLIEIAEKIENKIIELGGKPAFPTNLSINEIAAHYTPTSDDETKAHGLLKVDFGAHVDGWCSDTAFSIDLENSDENRKLISASQDALKNAIDFIKKNSNNLGNNNPNKFDEQSEEHFSEKGGRATSREKPHNPVTSGVASREGEEVGGTNNLQTSQIGKTIQETISSQGFNPIINLSGHEIDEWDLHAGLTIPNLDNGSNEELENGLYAIEPFATNGNGKVRDGKPSGIYQLINNKNIRSPTAREILEYIIEEYQTLPFCQRWIVKKFGTKALFALRQLEQNGNLHHFAQLIESGNGIVSQAEHTILISDEGVEITTG